jgi:phosphoenolpyruvate carboxykinase (GTP)
LRWMIDRCKGVAQAADTAIGQVPRTADLDTRGLDVAPAALEELLAVSPPLWHAEFEGIGTYLAEFGERVPEALRTELKAALSRVSAS